MPSETYPPHLPLRKTRRKPTKMNNNNEKIYKSFIWASKVFLIAPPLIRSCVIIIIIIIFFNEDHHFAAKKYQNIKIQTPVNGGRRFESRKIEKLKNWKIEKLKNWKIRYKAIWHLFRCFFALKLAAKWAWPPINVGMNKKEQKYKILPRFCLQNENFTCALYLYWPKWKI